MSKSFKLKVGDVFSVELMTGGHAYGYVTYVGRFHRYSRQALANIVATIGSHPEPPANIEQCPVGLTEIWISELHFIAGPSVPQWKVHSRLRKRFPKPVHRYYRYGSSGGEWRRVDLENPRERKIIPEREALKYPLFGSPDVEYATARIDLALNHRKGDVVDMCFRWARRHVRRGIAKTARGSILDRSPVRGLRLPAVKRGIDGRASLSFPVPGSHIPVFQGAEREGNGYDWTQVVRVLVREHAPQIARKLRYDPEADTFSVSSKDDAAVRKVADLLRRVAKNRKELEDAIARSAED